MIALRAAQVAGWCGAELVRGSADTTFTGVSIDSRTLATGTLFVAIAGPRHDGPDFGDEPGRSSGNRESHGTDWMTGNGDGPPVELVRPFENLPELPDDLAEAFDTMKLAILRHKTDAWQQIPAADVLRALDALKALVLAPSESAPF